MNYPYTEEASIAREGKIFYEEAFEAIYDRRNALSTAHPFAAGVLGQGTDFVYRQGTVCVFNAGIVSVTDLNSQKKTARLDIQAIVRPVVESKSRACGNFSVRLLYYSDKILAVHAIPRNSSEDSHVFAINTVASLPDSQRVIDSVQLASHSKLFARHNAHYLYYGTHTGIGDDGHHKWDIDGFSLHEGFPPPERERPVLLDRFHGSDIGSTAAFEIHNDYFYAVSNRGAHEVNEMDYTSFYQVARFPLNKPNKVQINDRVFRRNHKQGPIHDSWTDLSLQLDERTNKTVIVESRREWAQASSRQSRTFYVTEMDFGEEDDMEKLSNEDLPPYNDFCFDASNSFQWKSTQDPYCSSQHAEFSPTDPSPRSFTRARTKFRAYSYPSTCFVELVEDDQCCNDPSQPICLRLRIGSRRELGPDNAPMSKKGETPIDGTRPTFVDTQSRYRQPPVCMWPPPASRCPCSARLHSILNPSLPSTNQSTHPFPTSRVTGILDSSRLVVMIKPKQTYSSNEHDAPGRIVVINFCRLPAATSPTPLATGPSPLAQSDSKMREEVQSWNWSDNSMGRCGGRRCQ